jgi:hypothetical protein
MLAGIAVCVRRMWHVTCPQQCSSRTLSPDKTFFCSSAHLLNVGGDIDGGSTSAMTGSLHVTRSLLVRYATPERREEVLSHRQ